MIRLVATGLSMKRRDGFNGGWPLGSSSRAAVIRPPRAADEVAQDIRGLPGARARGRLLNRSRLDELGDLPPHERPRIRGRREPRRRGRVDRLRLGGKTLRAIVGPAGAFSPRLWRRPRPTPPRPRRRRRRRPVTLAPSRSRSTPSITTLSPAARPEVIVVDLPSVGAGDDVALRDCVVGVEEIDEMARRPDLDRGVGRQRDALQRVDQQAHVDELLRKQDALRIVEGGAHLDRAGGDVDLAVVGRQRPLGELFDVGAVEGGDRNGRAGIQPLGDARQIVLRGREDDADRVELGDDDDACGVRRLQIIARVDQPDADAAVIGETMWV